MKWIEANGVMLRWNLQGSGAGPVVVLIHEAGGSLESWEAVIANLHSGYRILRYDQRGFGMSETARELSLPRMVIDLIALLDALGLQEPVHLVGTAIGGSIALAAAALYPDRVSSVFATSPVTGGLPVSAHESLNRRAATVKAEGMRAVTDVSLLRSWPVELRKQADAFTQYRNRYLTNDPIGFAALTRAFLDIEMGHLLPRIHCPAMVVGCRYDAVKPPGECASAAGQIPQGRYAELDAGHFAALQEPQAFCALLTEFLESVHVSA